MGARRYTYLACDFETTVYDGQEDTQVWAAASVPLYTEDVRIQGSIGGWWDHVRGLDGNLVCYFHNLKFDGAFILNMLLRDKILQPAKIKLSQDWHDIRWMKERDMPNRSYKYVISAQGQWYTIIIRVDSRFIEIRDSLKLMPLSLAALGDSFKTKHRKLTMEYKGFRYPNCPRTAHEDEYIGNDVLVLKESLEYMFAEGHNRLTIGSCCFAEFKAGYTKDQFTDMFPNQYQVETPDPERYAAMTAGEYVVRTYHGGWCYNEPSKQGKVLGKGLTADVNSLYPFVMHSMSGTRYPIGMPTFWAGDYIPEEAKDPRKVYFIRIRCRFHVKHGYLPTVQIKHDWRYKGNEWLTTSDIKDPNTGEYCKYMETEDGEELIRPILSMTCMDHELFLEHYDVEDYEILDGCYYSAVKGIFDEYIDKYKEIKTHSTGAKRTIAKLFSNNLYGKEASSQDSSFKVAMLDEEGALAFARQEEYDKEPGYIPCGSMITSAARCYTIRHAQKNYHGPDAPGFCYADTDSIHCDLEPEDLIDINVHPTEYGCWKLESYWDKAIFVRQKTYVEHVTHEDGKPVEPHDDIKACGMPKKCKKLLEISFNGYKPFIGDEYTKEEMDIIKVKREYADFGYDLPPIPGKLIPKQIRGGVLLVDVGFKMRKGGLW